MENTTTTTATRRRKNSRFRRGSGRYMCRACTFLTRETGKGESEVALCRECYDGEPGNDLELLTAQEFAAKWPKKEAVGVARNPAVTAERVDPYEYASHLASLNID